MFKPNNKKIWDLVKELQFKDDKLHSNKNIAKFCGVQASRFSQIVRYGLTVVKPEDFGEKLALYLGVDVEEITKKE